MRKWINILMIMIVITVINTMAQGYVYSDYEWKTYNGHQYAVTMSHCSFSEAQSEAEALGGYLAEINNMAENDWLTNNFGGYYRQGHEGVSSDSLVWIGLVYIGGDINLRTSWQWVNGEQLMFDPLWWIGYALPLDSGGMPCVYLHTCTHFLPGTWWNHDYSVLYPSYGIIEIPEPISVDVDIKPGSYPNSINLGSQGLIPVAIFSSDEFDATTVNPETIELAGTGVAVRGKGNKYMAHEEDINQDGFVDLVVQVETENLDPDSFQDGLALVTGTTFDGQDIQGSDEIIIVPIEE